MNEIKFEWDQNKARSNQKKHGISFGEAQSVFYDDFAIEFCDPEHSTEEDRFLMVGLSYKARVLVTSHCVREPGNVIRIISARKATKKEANYYWEQRS